ncbi:hypothetical protein [Caviibacter abscessus]|uniref:hypothetical protein n=1 Tax=Caviibacter abscessus TaxID=1766719 RepID=UPI000837CC98|nr:hypothetical protein [Caviibacter abscessus]
MNYKIKIFLKKDIDLSNNKVMEFIDTFNEKFDVLDENFIFYENNSIEYYNELKLNCYLNYHINAKNQKDISLFLETYNFIDKFNITVENNLKNNEDIVINTKQIDKLVNSIDKLFFIRKEFQEMTKYLDEEKKEKYSKLLKELSLTKYFLKKETVNLRIVDLEEQLNKMDKTLKEYGQLFGLDLKLNFKIVDLKLDKILFFNIKSALIDVIYNIILAEVDRKNIELNYSKNNVFNIYLLLKQEFNQLKIEISAHNHKLNYNKIIERFLEQKIIEESNVYSKNEIYNMMFTNDFLASSKDYEIKERELALLNFYNTSKNLNGKMYIRRNENDEITYVAKIPLQFLILNATIVKIKENYYAIETKCIEDISDFFITNTFTINNFMYYKNKEAELPIINMYNEAIKALTVVIKNQRHVFLTDDLLYQEQIFVRPLQVDSNMYIGDCLLKDNKRAYIIDFNKYLQKGVKYEN